MKCSDNCCCSECCKDIPTGSQYCSQLDKYNREKLKPLVQYIDTIDWCNYGNVVLKDIINMSYCMFHNIHRQICAIWSEIDSIWKNINDLWNKVNSIDQDQFQLVSCKEVGSGIFSGTSFSGSYQIDKKGKTRTLTTYQLRVQVLSTTRLVIPAGTQIPITFEGKSNSATKLPCLDGIVENFEQIVWHNYNIQTENDVPVTWTTPCYIGTPGRGSTRNFPGNVFIIAKEQDVVFEANVPYQTAMTWAMEPIVTT